MDAHTHEDERGAFTEIFRKEWGLGIEPVQWNYVRSHGDVLRGVHVHLRHTDLLMCVEGTLLLGLHDCRPNSPTEGKGTLVELTGTKLRAAVVPPGVAHGFYSPVPSAHVYTVSRYWDASDDLGCAWNDPELGIEWPTKAPNLSARDQGAGPLKVLKAEVLRAMNAGAV